MATQLKITGRKYPVQIVQRTLMSVTNRPIDQLKRWSRNSGTMIKDFLDLLFMFSLIIIIIVVALSYKMGII